MEVVKRQFKMIFKTPEKFISKKDGLFAVFYFLYLMIFIYLLGLFMFKMSYISDLSKHFSNKYLFDNLLYLPISIFQVLPIFLVLRLGNQPLWTIGITSRKLIKSIIIGIFAWLPFSISKLYNFINHNYHSHLKGNEVGFDLLYFLVFIAFVEELIFRGYIQTRVHSLVKNKVTAIIIVSIMFAFMHIPFQMIKAHMSFSAFVINDWPHLLITGMMHAYLVYIYTRTNNLVAPSIAHGINDFVQTSIY